MKANLLLNYFSVLVVACTIVTSVQEVHAQQWKGSADSTGKVYRRGSVGIGNVNYIPNGIDLLLKGDYNRPATMRFEHNVPNNFAWDIFPDQNALKFFYSFDGQATQYKASLNSEGIFSINQIESNEWIGQGHRENYLHFHSSTGALGQFTKNPTYYMQSNYPAVHTNTELGIFLNKHINDNSGDVPKIAFGNTKEAVFTIRNENIIDDKDGSSFNFFTRYNKNRSGGTELKLFGAEANGKGEYFGISRKNGWAEISNYSEDADSRFLALQTRGGSVGIGNFGTANLYEAAPKATLHIRQSGASFRLENTDANSEAIMSFGNSNKTVFTFDDANATVGTYRDFQFKATTATNGNNQSARLVLSGPTLNASIPTTLSITHDGFQGLIATPSNALSLLPNGGTVYIGQSGQGLTGSFYTLNVAGTINAATTIYTAGLQLTSDSTLKTDIKKLTNSSEILDKISGYTYNYNQALNDKLPAGKRVGLLAQEVQQVLPEAIDTNANGKLSVDYTMLIPLLLESHKKLQEEVTSLKAQLANNGIFSKTTAATVTITRPQSKAGLELVQNIPNPTQGKTTITYTVPLGCSSGELTVFSLQGNLLLKTDNLEAGTHSLLLDLSGNPPGVYIYTLAASGYTPQSRSLILE